MNLQIEYLRKKEKITQEELSEKIGVSRQNISDWERGKVFPPLERLIKLSEIFDVSLDYLVYGKDRNIQDTKIEEIKHLHFSKNQNCSQYIIGEKEKLVASINQSENMGNTLVVAGTGAGKSRSYIIPNVKKAIKRNESIFVIGNNSEEIKNVVADYIKEYNYKVNIFNLSNDVISNKIDIFNEVQNKGKIDKEKFSLLYDIFFYSNNIIKKILLDSIFSIAINKNIKSFSLIVKKIAIEFSFKDFCDFIINDTSVSENTKEMLMKLDKRQVEEAWDELKLDFIEIYNENIIMDAEKTSITVSSLLEKQTITFITLPNYNEFGLKYIGFLLTLVFFNNIQNKDDTIKDIFIDNISKIKKYLKIGPIIQNPRTRLTVNFSILLQNLYQLDDFNDIGDIISNFLYMGCDSQQNFSRLSKILKVSEEEIANLSNNKVIFKRKQYDACILNKLNET